MAATARELPSIRPAMQRRATWRARRQAAFQPTFFIPDGLVTLSRDSRDAATIFNRQLSVAQLQRPRRRGDRIRACDRHSRSRKFDPILAFFLIGSKSQK